MDAIDPQGVHVANRAVVNPGDHFLPRLRVPPHEADADLEVLLLGQLGGLQPAAHRRSIGRERFFREDVDTLLHGVFEIHGTKGGVRRQQHDIVRAPDNRWPSCRRRNPGTAGRAARPPARETCALSALRLPCSRSSNRSAMACSLIGPPLVTKALSTAPVPRPPQPTRASLIVEFSAAWQRGIAMVANADTATVCPASRRNSRRDVPDDARDMSKVLIADTSQRRLGWKRSWWGCGERLPHRLSYQLRRAIPSRRSR